MKSLHTLTRLAAGSAIMATAALAGAGVAQADGYSPGATYARPSSWSGFYFGVNAGYSWQNIDLDPSALAGIGAAGIHAVSVTSTEGIVGGQIGLQHQFGNIVLGVEGSSAWTFTGGVSDSAECAPPTIPGTPLRCGSRLNDILSVGGRAGWAMSHWMPYVAGGYANARFDSHAQTGSPVTIGGLVIPTGSPIAQWSSRSGGWYLGGGVDMKVAQSFTVGLEYRHYEFENNSTAAWSTPPFTIQNVGNASTGGSVDTVTLRASWLFGRPGAAPLK